MSGAKVALVHVFDPASYNGLELYLRRAAEIAEDHQSLGRDRLDSFLQDELPAPDSAPILVAGDVATQIGARRFDADVLIRCADHRKRSSTGRCRPHADLSYAMARDSPFPVLSI